MSIYSCSGGDLESCILALTAVGGHFLFDQCLDDSLRCCLKNLGGSMAVDYDSYKHEESRALLRRV